MIAGILSDTHDVEDSAIDGVMEEFEKRGVEHIVHCGDLESPHMVPKLFRGYPVTYALNAEQMEKPAFQNPPPGWRPTVPGQRIIDIKHVRCYVGHKRSFDFLNGTEGNLMNFLEELRNKNDGLRWVFSGHTHHQFFVQTDLVDFVNPGALQDSLDDNYEFAIVDTQKYEVIFSRIQKIAPPIKTFSVGIISDSDRISDFDPTIWGKLATEFKKRDARTIIHCGNISLKDIGRPELENFTVYYNLRPDQFYVKEPPN